MEASYDFELGEATMQTLWHLPLCPRTSEAPAGWWPAMLTGPSPSRNSQFELTTSNILMAIYDSEPDAFPTRSLTMSIEIAEKLALFHWLLAHVPLTTPQAVAIYAGSTYAASLRALANANASPCVLLFFFLLCGKTKMSFYPCGEVGGACRTVTCGKSTTLL
jgi:hypothetical protein